MNEIEKLRRLNREGFYRTDVDNLFLLEMATADMVGTLIDEVDLSYTFGDELKLFSGITFGEEEDEFDQTLTPENMSAVELF